jgi:replication-associated recombination protein RarA
MFNDLVLHPRTLLLAEKLVAHLPHGLIIEGPSGTGTVFTAKAMAEKARLQVFVIQPKKNVKGEMIVDAKEGSVIIDDIRQLYQQTRTTQPTGQVYIIDTGERSMTIAAQNAFLKLLEEPRQGLHFIIATHQYNNILPTIASRAQQLSLLPITTEQANDMINQLNITDATKRTRLAFVGRGLPALIVRLSQDNDLYEHRVSIMRDAKTMLGNDVYEKLAVIHRYRDNRGDSLTLLDDMNHQLQTIVRGQPDPRLVQDIAKHLETQNRINASGNIRLQLAADVL